MITDYKVIVDEKGMASQPGIHFGGAQQQPRLELRLRDYALFRLPGGSFWDGSANAYHPSSYELVRLEGVQVGRHLAFHARIVESIERVYPGRKWRATRLDLLTRQVELVSAQERDE